MKKSLLLFLVFTPILLWSQTSLKDKIDPESKIPLDAMLQQLPGGFNKISDIKERRKILDEIFASEASSEVNDDILISDYSVPGLDGAPNVQLRVYSPKKASNQNPGIYYIHGGGMILGNIKGEEANAINLALRLNAVVVSVEYRLAPEYPYPAPVKDCYAGLVWMAKNSERLKVDSDRIAVYGGSAGGGLTIATTLMSRDKKFPKICFQMALYPMIDDRNTTVSSQEVTDIGIWDREANIEAWNWYLGGEKADQYAAPARAKNLKGLPPTFIDVGEADLFRDEDIDFVSRLIQSGVTTEFHLYPGAYHASEIFAPNATLSKTILARRHAALEQALYPKN